MREDCIGECNEYIVENEGLSVDEWIHVAGTYDGAWMKLYIDAELVAEGNDANSILLSQDTNDLSIGNRGEDDDNEFDGMIDDVQIYDYALPADQSCYIASRGDGIVDMDMDSIANIFTEEDRQAVNFRDFADLAMDWLKPAKLWP